MKRYYILHYFDPANVGSFLLVSLLGLILVLALVLLIAKLQIQRQLKEETEEKAKKIRRKKHQRRQYQIVESFYELVFSGTSILLFLSLYYIIDERLPQISMYWEKYQDVVLLVFIVLSVFLTSWLDVVLVKLTHLEPEQKASVRLISVFYIVLILLYIRFIYEDTNYDGLILYFLTLTVGRFLYFDFTVKSFLETMRGVLENLPLLVIMSAYSGFRIKPSGFLPPLYAVCGGSRFHQAGAWRQMGSRCCRFPVCDRLAGSFCRTWLCTAVWHVKKNIK